MQRDDRKPHFWIPDNEIEHLEKILTARPRERGIVYSEHGSKLSRELQIIADVIDANVSDDTLAHENLCVFKVKLPEGEKIQHKKDIFDVNGMYINAVKDESSAVVTTTREQFQILRNRINNYMNNGVNKTSFDHIDEFIPYIGSEKNSNQLRKTTYALHEPQLLDIQLMCVPNLSSQNYNSILSILTRKIKENNGVIQQEPYRLSDNTPVIRVIIPSETLSRYEKDSAIYRIEMTRFFDYRDGECTSDSLDQIKLDTTVNQENLPIVAVLDSGVHFVSPFDSLVTEHWTAPGCIGGDAEHGTSVASRVAFRDFGKQAISGTLKPRARIIDCNIMDGSVPENIYINRIQNAVERFSTVTKIFNLSSNYRFPIEGDEMSIVGFELDALQLKYNIQFVVSAGNHNLWETENSMEDIIDDDDSQIAAPADSMLSIVVGAVSGKTHPGCLSEKNIITSYSRRGPGFNSCSKPDISSYGGNILVTPTGSYVPFDEFSLVMDRSGSAKTNAGTSFTAPDVAGHLAEILTIMPNQDVLLAKALLYHNAEPVWDDDIEEEELIMAHNQYGRGIASVPDSMYSSASKVTFVRTGTLNRTTKERLKIYMPEILAAQIGRNVAKVSVTCVSHPAVNRTKGTEYLGAYVRASLKKAQGDGTLNPVQMDFKEGRKKWDVCYQFSKVFSNFHSGDWQIWLELFGRWAEQNFDIPYALVVTIEDLSGTLDVYNEIQEQNRYQALNTVRVQLRA